MSGLEIAGVVLGSLPLVISALEHYAEGVATAKRFWRYKSELRSIILQINTERGIFVNTLEQLLTGIVKIDQMDHFLANPCGDAWREDAVETKLQERLRKAYTVYADNVRGMERALAKMMKKLALDEDGKPQFSEPSTFKQEYKRLKFSISKSEYAEQLALLRNHNQALSRLTKQSLDLEPTRGNAMKTSYPNFNAFRDYAKGLYQTLLSGWRCGCDGHAVNLRLEHRSETKKQDHVTLENFPFRVVFSYTPGQEMWKEADIRPIDDISKRAMLPSICQTKLQSSASTSNRRVRFDQSNVSVVQSGTTSAAASNTALTNLAVSVTPPKVATPTPTQIDDLCKAIMKLQQPQRDMCLGYLLDHVNQKHGVYAHPDPPSGYPRTQQWAAYSLKEVLARTPQLRGRLTQNDKLRIAVDLASNVLQLYKTPWIDEQWGKEDVWFIQRPGASPSSVYEHPFVCRKIQRSSQTPTQLMNTIQQAATCRVIRNQTLYTLGILLIELWYGKSIEELQHPNDLNCAGTPGVSWCTAERLIEQELEFDAGQRYSEAVRRCIRCDFDRKDMSLENEGFQRAVYDGVVVLLERNHHQFNCLD